MTGEIEKKENNEGQYNKKMTLQGVSQLESAPDNINCWPEDLRMY